MSMWGHGYEPDYFSSSLTLFNHSFTELHICMSVERGLRCMILDCGRNAF